jgi:molybdopterin converting factor small subunit
VATVLLPRSLLALFPTATRRNEVVGDSVDAVLDELDAAVPGMRDRLVEAGPRLRPHINVFVDGSPADLGTPVGTNAVVHVIPAVSGGSWVASSGPASEQRRERIEAFGPLGDGVPPAHRAATAGLVSGDRSPAAVGELVQRCHGRPDHAPGVLQGIAGQRATLG